MYPPRLLSRHNHQHQATAVAMLYIIGLGLGDEKDITVKVTDH
jgi:hypothetical protein